ncbi:variant erythrocyte surface antigen-1, beta subunit [Babesia caballi]|uniref:Variant erythrocyte surface antigen-1, beta subunit n=1 Tax=Babesia caballi TaxID=5871 RepID=A0AAV4LTD4_BABCB|nr:variant erythrocyte surface antigen-1, beta subunit [Babesia caballi]
MSQGGGFDFTGDKGIILNGRNYTTTYKDATWNGSYDAKDMARIFLCAAAITFLGLSFLCWKCQQTQGGWNRESLTRSGINSGLGPFMTAMGYGPEYLNRNKYGRDIASLLEDDDTGFDGLVQPEHHPIYYSFVDKLETQYNLQQKALDSPLTACYIFAKLYFKSQFQNVQGGDIDGTLTAIKEALKTFKSSCMYLASDLSDQIDKFLKIAMTLH